MAIDNTGNTIVHVESNDFLDNDGKKRFTRAHLETAKRLVCAEAYPEYFGEGIMKGLVATKVPIRLIDAKKIAFQAENTNITQDSRTGGKNPEYKKIKANITTFGYKLRNLPILVFDNNDDTYTPINGRTRSEILLKHGFDNLICVVYEAKPEMTKLQIEDAISKFGLRSNAENDPAGDLMLETVFEECIKAIKKKYITLSETDIYHNRVIVRARVDSVCGFGKFTENKRCAIVHRVVNSFSKTGRVMSYSVTGAAEEWIADSKFIDIDPVKDSNGRLIKKGLKYIVMSCETLDKVILRASQTAYQNKDCEVRVIIHTGTLTGFELDDCYVGKIFKFREEWIQKLSTLSYGFFNSQSPANSPISLYGCLPAVEDLGSLDDLKKFVPYTVASLNDLLMMGNYNDGLEDI